MERTATVVAWLKFRGKQGVDPIPLCVGSNIRLGRGYYGISKNDMSVSRHQANISLNASGTRVRLEAVGSNSLHVRRKDDRELDEIKPGEIVELCGGDTVLIYRHEKVLRFQYDISFGPHHDDASSLHNTWACPACTFANEPEHLQCSICRSQRPSAVKGADCSGDLHMSSHAGTAADYNDHIAALNDRRDGPDAGQEVTSATVVRDDLGAAFADMDGNLDVPHQLEDRPLQQEVKEPVRKKQKSLEMPEPIQEVQVEHKFTRRGGTMKPDGPLALNASSSAAYADIPADESNPMANKLARLAAARMADMKPVKRKKPASTAASSSAAGDERFLHGVRVYIHPNGISSKQREILRQQVERHGGDWFDELPKKKDLVIVTSLPDQQTLLKSLSISGLHRTWEAHQLDWLTNSLKERRRLGAHLHLLPKETAVTLTHADDVDRLRAVEHKLSPEQVAAHNAAIASKLSQMADVYKVMRDDWRVKTLEVAAKIIAHHPEPIIKLFQAHKIAGVGKRTADKVDEILKTGRIARLDALLADPKTQVLLEFAKVKFIGPAKAQNLYDRGHRSIDDLRNDPALDRRQKIGLKYFEDFQRRMDKEEVAQFEQLIGGEVHQQFPSVELVMAGSYRRGQPTCGDMDLLVFTQQSIEERKTSNMMQRIVDRLLSIGIITEHIQLPTDKYGFDASYKIYSGYQDNEVYMGVAKLPGGPYFRRIDIRIYHVSEKAYALLYFTGSDVFNRALRLYCNHRGLSLSDHGLVPVARQGRQKHAIGGNIACATEDDIFKRVGLPAFTPSQRNAVPVELRSHVDGGKEEQQH